MMPMAGIRFCASLSLVSAACAAEGADPRLTAIIERMAGNLARVPNCTCTQTVERFKRGEACRECECADRNIFVLIGTGMIVTGDFASFADHVFVMDCPEFTYAGETVLEGRRTHRYSYRIGADRSRFSAQIGAEEGYSAYAGSFWTDAENLEPVPPCCCPPACSSAHAGPRLCASASARSATPPSAAARFGCRNWNTLPQEKP